MATPPNNQHFEEYTHRLLFVAGITILLYDHLATLSDEYTFIWRAPRSVVSVIFVLTRYVAVMTTIAITGITFGFDRTELSPKGCFYFSLFRQISLIVVHLLIVGMQFLRTCALYSHSKRIIALMLSTVVAGVIVIVWTLRYETRNVSLSSSDSRQSIESSLQHLNVYLAGLWEALLIYDTMIFFLTVFKARQGWMQYRESHWLNIMYVMYRDGVMYFGVILLAQGTNVFALYVFPPTLQASLSTLASSISVAMVSRLTLNLRQLGRQNHSTLIPLSSTAITSSKFTTQIILTEYDEDALNDAEEEDFCRHRVSL